MITKLLLSLLSAGIGAVVLGFSCVRLADIFPDKGNDKQAGALKTIVAGVVGSAIGGGIGLVAFWKLG